MQWIERALDRSAQELRELKQRLKQRITDAITATAERGHNLYLEIEKVARNNPQALAKANRALDLSKPGIELVTDLNPQTMDWDDLVNAWLFEVGPEYYNFDKDSATTKQLFQEDGVIKARQEAMNRLSKNNPEPVSHLEPYDVAEFYESLRERNEVTIFLGSYTTKVKVVKHSDGTATLFFEVINSTSWESGTRFRKAEKIVKAHRGVILSRARGTSGIHLGGTIYQTWRWQETVRAHETTGGR